MKRKWNERQLVSAVKGSKSYRSVLKMLGLKPAGGNYTQLKRYIKGYGLNTNHFTGQGWNLGLKFKPKCAKPIDEILKVGIQIQSYKLKKRLFAECLKQERCEDCGWAVMSKDGRIPLELNHKNGDSTDNRLVNLEILCPNCHSLRPFYRGSKLKK